jgi:transcriptional antiterminator RfaH
LQKRASFRTFVPEIARKFNVTFSNLHRHDGVFNNKLTILQGFKQGQKYPNDSLQVRCRMTKWYAFQSKFQKESLVCAQLRLRNIEAFFPCLHVRPVNPRSGRTRPYFPGYVFGRLDLEATGSSIVNWIPGAIGIVSFGGEPAPVPEHLIATLQQHLETINASKAELTESFQSGDLVAIQRGPFAGYEAIFNAHLPGRDRVEVLLKLLEGSQIRVELSIQQIGLKSSSLVKSM